MKDCEDSRELKTCCLVLVCSGSKSPSISYQDIQEHTNKQKGFCSYFYFLYCTLKINYDLNKAQYNTVPMRFNVIYSAKSIRKQEKIFTMLLNIKPVLMITIYTILFFGCKVIFDLAHIKVQHSKKLYKLELFIF